ncbi:helix-turn-helix domain-containing protein [Ilumatobacter sp.]|uniref:helix-turn-helix domain-containing protein n=1 Tax=Ilumatobacter sp. TaxID=1967498 RepID=UPI003AF9DA5E
MNIEPSDTWQSIPGCESPAEQFDLDDLDLLGEVTHPIRGAILRRLKSPRTVAELADMLDVPITRLYHHVNRLAGLGLIRIVAVRRVGAVTERRYQVIAKSFHVDNELLTSTNQRELSVALSSLFDVAKLGFQRFVEAGGIGGTPHEDERSTLSLGEVRLSDARRRELIQEVVALVQRFPSDVDDDDPTGSRVTLFVAAFEEQPDS